MSEEKQYISHKTVTATLNGDTYQVKCGDCAWIEPKDVFEQSYAEIGDNIEEIKVGDWIQAIGDNKLSYKVHRVYKSEMDFYRAGEEDGEETLEVQDCKKVYVVGHTASFLRSLHPSDYDPRKNDIGSVKGRGLTPFPQVSLKAMAAKTTQHTDSMKSGKVVKSLKNIGSARGVMKAKKRLKESNKNLNKAMQFIEPGYIDDKTINKVFLGHIKNQNEYIIELLEKLTNEGENE